MDQQCDPQVEIADNGLSATLILPKAFDRATLTPELCDTVLEIAGVNLESTSKDFINAFITQAQAAEPGRFQGVIAKGTPAIHGKEADIEWHLDPMEHGKAPETTQQDVAKGPAQKDEKPDGAINFYSQSFYTVVRAGDVLGKLYPEVPGTEGKDVRGKVLPSRSLKPLNFKYDESIGIDKHNNLIAKSDGILIRDHNTARVSDTIEVDQNVDFKTGNIDFKGNILVHRGVKDCFIVKATENIEVRGLIEAATLIAGKDLHAKGGFAGREQGLAEVQGNLYAKYLDAVSVQVGGNLCVEREVINCKSTVLGEITCPRGALIGGFTQVSGAVVLADLGAGAHSITELHIGVLPQLDPLIAQLAELTEKLIEERQKLVGEQEMIISNSGSKIAPTNQAKLDKITHEMGMLQLQLDRAEPSLTKARERAEELRRVDVKINRKIHPNAVLVFGRLRYRITDEIKGPIRITANKRGQLEIHHGESKPVLLSTESELRGAA